MLDELRYLAPTEIVIEAATENLEVKRTKPGVGGKVLRWVDSGAALRVIARQGDWLKVAARRLNPPVDEGLDPGRPGRSGGARYGSRVLAG